MAREWWQGGVVYQVYPRSMLALSRRLLSLRRKLPALALGSYRALDAGAGEVFAYLREHEDGRVLVALNFGPESRTLDLALAVGEAPGEVLCSTLMDREDEVRLGGLRLRPDKGVVVRLVGA